MAYGAGPGQDRESLWGSSLPQSNEAGRKEGGHPSVLEFVIELSFLSGRGRPKHHCVRGLAELSGTT